MAGNQLPTTIDICRIRGDTFPFVLTLKDSSGAAINITGNTFLLTVDPSESPPDALNNLFQNTGVVTDGPNGEVTFTLLTAEADQTPSDYFYDIQMTSGASIRTVAKGGWQVVQDVTK